MVWGYFLFGMLCGTVLGVFIMSMMFMASKEPPPFDDEWEHTKERLTQALAGRDPQTWRAEQVMGHKHLYPGERRPRSPQEIKEIIDRLGSI